MKKEEGSRAVATETTRPHAWFVTSLPVVRLIVLLFCAVVLLANKRAKSRGLAYWFVKLNNKRFTERVTVQ